MATETRAQGHVPGEPERRGARFVFLTDGLTDGFYLWRLDAANNRPLGRAEHPTTTLERCRRDAAALVASVTARRDDVLVSRVGTRWVWRLAMDATVAVSTHQYHRRVECLRGFVQFAAVAPDADPARGVTRSFGPRTLRRYTIVDAAQSARTARGEAQ